MTAATVADALLRFPTPYLRVIADHLRRGGADVDAWQTANGLSDAALSGPWINLPAAQFLALMRDAIDLSGDSALGLLIGERLAAGAHGMVGHAALHSTSLGQALDTLVRYAALRMPLLAFESDLDGSDWRLHLLPRQALGDLARPLLEATALAIHQLLASVQLGQSPVTAVALPFSLGKDLALARALFGVPIEDNADWCGLRLPRAALAASLPLADPDSFALAERQCREDWARRDGDGRWTDRLRAALTGPRLAHADVAVCARLLATSPRSLHRALAAEGTRFRDVVDELRRERAIQLLRSGAKLAWVAETLGYSDVANFRRAFRRWTGHAPAVLR